ncbi:MAG: heavy metal translocating P-type ATPase [Candidatus Hydrogenedentes bacterium]|nr:heavy metal translocating P-type ATPase [Candidatus Hydrogenedentota bacterium]
MSNLAFKIRGMDCAEEIALLKREVAPLVGGEESLAFDLLNGRMVVRDAPAHVTTENIQQAVARTGMQAIRVTPGDVSDAAGSPHSFWSRHGRLATCAASGLLSFSGFVVHTWAHGWQHIFSMADEAGFTFPWFSILLYALAIVTGGWFIFPKALRAVRRLQPDMNLLMTVAVIGAVAIGQWSEAATVTFLFALALLLESWSIGRARHAIHKLMDLSPQTARYICPTDGAIEEKPVEEVPVGVTVVVRPGEKIPLDGAVTKGATTVNQSPITGESRPVAKEVGDEVFAGTLNNEGAFEFCVTKPAADSTLARIIRMVEEAQSRRAPSERWVERFARYYTPAMMGLALAIAIFLPLVGRGTWIDWFYEALVILVIACPCALVISTPVSIIAGLTSAAHAGVLIKGGVYLEIPARLRAVALDKTGTLTSGRPEVQQIVPMNGHSEHELLARAAALESHSNHPLAQAVLRRARKEGVTFLPADSFQAIRGKGAEGYIQGRLFWVGSHRLVHERDQETPVTHEKALELEDAGHSVVVTGNDYHVCGLISVADELRPRAAEAVRALKDAGIEHVVMLTGDNDGTARAVAEAAQVESYFAELLPEDKVEAVGRLVRDYGRVAMVGDGVNDAPAMAAATLGVAMGAAGSDTAIETADVALMSDDLSKLAWLVHHSRRTLRIIKQNITFALGLKLCFVILALSGLATLWMAIAADMGASLLVILNGLRLLRHGA